MRIAQKSRIANGQISWAFSFINYLAHFIKIALIYARLLFNQQPKAEIHLKYLMGIFLKEVKAFLIVPEKPGG